MTQPALPPALQAARWAREPRRRVWLDGQRVGSVAEAHLPLLAEHPADFAISDQAVALVAPAAQRAGRLAALHRRWHDEGHIRGWRDEPYGLHALGTAEPGPALLAIERAAARFWGSLSFGAHANGFVRGPDGRPAALWIAQRAATKATDPGLHDNLVGGGVPLAQAPADTLLREAWEEAGLAPEVAARALPARVLHLARDVPEGFQRESLHAFDLELTAQARPHNQDGEVQAFALRPWPEALALALGRDMTVDAALVTLDFGLRHGLFTTHERAWLGPALDHLALPPMAA